MAVKKSKSLVPNVTPWQRDKDLERKASGLQRVKVLVNGRKLKMAWRVKP